MLFQCPKNKYIPQQNILTIQKQRQLLNYLFFQSTTTILHLKDVKIIVLTALPNTSE